MTTLLKLSLIALTLNLCACQTPSKPTPPAASATGQAQFPPTKGGVDAPSPRVDRISMFSGQAPVNVDGRPGADGLNVRVYLFQLAERTQTVRLKQGTLEFLIFDGKIDGQALSRAKPMQVWTYEASRLDQFGATSQIGPGYSTTLLWNKPGPKSDVVTLSVRLLRPSGRALYARPITLPLTPK